MIWLWSWLAGCYGNRRIVMTAVESLIECWRTMWVTAAAVTRVVLALTWRLCSSVGGNLNERWILSAFWWAKCRLSVSLSETLHTYLFIHYKSLRMRTSSAKSLSNNTARAHWRKRRMPLIYLIWVHAHRLYERANSHLLINSSYRAVIQYEASGRCLVFMTCVLLWCICHTDYCSAALQKAFSITERLVALI